MTDKPNFYNDNDETIVNPANPKSRLAKNLNFPETVLKTFTSNETSTHVGSYYTNIDPSVEINLEPGSIIKSTFELVSVLGEGGMGTVYKALNLVWAEVEARDPYVAIKVLKPELSENKQLVRSLYSDFDRTKMLANCPNIIKVLGFDRDGPIVFMTMEYLNGETLGDYLKHIPLSLAQAWFIIEGIGTALAYAHENNIVHRDIKPGNIIITKENTVKVLDFGIASKINEHEGDETKFSGHELGALTEAYASPEMQRGYQPDARDDIYAFACVIYEILTGKQFYKQKTHKASPIKGLTRKQIDILNKSLAFERDLRTSNVHELLNKLRPVKIQWPKYLTLASVVALALGVGFLKWGINVSQPTMPTKSSTPIINSQPSIPAPKPIQTPEKISTPIVAPVPSIQPQEPKSSETSFSNTSSDGIVQMHSSKPEYKNGESFHLNFRLNQPMYVRVIDRDPNGKVTMLRPNVRQADILLPANKEHFFPPKGFKVPVKGTAGNCTLTIIASNQPFLKTTKLLNDDGSVSQQIQANSYSWAQIRYILR